MSEMPGPDVGVKARAPFQPAPTAMPIEANSSSDLLANLRTEEAHDAVLHSANLELLEEVVEQDPNSQVLLSEWADQISNDPVTMQEALTALPHDLGALVEGIEADI
ncbi:hypothetical protein [Maricaulis sp.]|uniref:hypothetical protein n=1 Tax=Maricaulis sp. TaxID=1486257 RepID=UPI003513CB39